MNEWRNNKEIVKAFKNGGLWVFGYGSLLWAPGFSYYDKQKATLFGYHRKLCIWSWRYRGTPEKPGLVFGLDQGGSCAGEVFRIDEKDKNQAMDLLWEREMFGDFYLAKFFPATVNNKKILALCFIANHASRQYIKNLTQEKIIQIVNSAYGKSGSNKDYVVQTAKYLNQRHINDISLHNIYQQLEQKAT